MSYNFDHGRYYRMPTHFGPTPGPRQIPKGQHVDPTRNPKRLAVNVSYLSTVDALQALLPPSFELPEDAEPVLTAEIQYLKEIDWLAGRGYNTLGVKFPATFIGTRERISGVFLAVLWETLADPIISGRDELGFNKIWCEVPEPISHAGRVSISANWLGHQFFQMELNDLVAGQLSFSGTNLSAPPNSQGMLHHKYIPKTGHPGEADAQYATITPLANPNVTIESRLDGTGSFKFIRSRWEDLPTQYNVINMLSALPLVEFRGASIVRSFGGKDFSDQRMLD